MAALAGDYCGPGLAAAGFGFICVFFGVGQAVSPALGGGLAQVVGSFAPTFLLAGALLLGCAVAALRLPARASPPNPGVGMPHIKSVAEPIL